MGIVLAIVGGYYLLSGEAFKAAIEAIKDSVPAGTEEKNIKAFEAGYNLV